MRTLPALACLLLLPLLGGGCDDQDEAKREQGSGRVVQGEATPLGDWLDARSTQSPTTWLVERMAASGQTITPAEVEAASAFIRGVMEKPHPLDAPLEVSIGVGASWGEAH